MAAKRILVVDDGMVDRMKLSMALKKLKASTVEAKSGQEALDAVRLGNIDLIFLDLLMPDMDGFETLSHLAHIPQAQGVPVVVVSSLKDADELQRAMDLGASAHLAKPFSGTELEAALQHAL